MYRQSLQIVSLCLLLVLVAGGKKSDPSPPNPLNGPAGKIKDVPFLVQLREGSKFVCSGTLVTDRHVATAARCLEGKPHANFVVISGAQTITDPGVNHEVKSYKTHATEDIAVLVLKTPVTNISLPKLPTSNVVAPRTDIEVFGWSLTTHDSKIQAKASNLRKLVTKVSPKDTCSHKSPNSFCAPVSKKLAAGCGDPGSPALDSTRKTLLGISKGYCSKSGSSQDSYVSAFVLKDMLQ